MPERGRRLDFETFIAPSSIASPALEQVPLDVENFIAPSNSLLDDRAARAAIARAAAIAAATDRAKLRSSLSSPFGIRLESTGARAIPAPLTQVILQTLDASPENPYLVTFDQHILDPFTGSGQFDLVERDAIRRSFGGVSAGGKPILTDPSGVMNWQSGDADKIIQVGRNPGGYFKILSRQSPIQVTLDRNITLPSIELILTMDGESEVTLATKAGFTNGDTTGGHSHFEKPITSDKVYSVVFVPGTAGDGIYSASARALYLPT